MGIHEMRKAYIALIWALAQLVFALLAGHKRYDQLASDQEHAFIASVYKQ